MSNENQAQSLAEHSLEKQQLLYYQNKGQLVDTDGNLIPEVEYVVKQNGMKVYIRKTGLSYVFEKTECVEKVEVKLDPLKREIEYFDDLDESIEVKLSMHRIDINFIGASAPIRKVESGKTGSPEHFYLAHCPDGVTSTGLEKVVMEELYPGIDLILYTKEGALKYDWLVKAGANPNQIEMEIKGADQYKIDEYGALRIETPMGTITESAPEIFQGETQIEGGYIMENGQIRFSIGTYNKGVDLLIDPIREWATYYGGSAGGGAGDNYSDYSLGGGCDTDSDGNVYFQGTTFSSNFPVSSGAFQPSMLGNSDVYIVKLDPSGTRLWATFFGGLNGEYGEGCCSTDIDGNLFFQGRTTSYDLPVSIDAFQLTKTGGTDAFLVKFNPLGERVWATYVGGIGNDVAKGGCATDNEGNVFIHGYTNSTDFPVSSDAYLVSIAGYYDSYIVKFNQFGERLWGTFYGGSGIDYGVGGCATDSDGNVFFQGYTENTDLPVSPGAFQPTNGGSYDSYFVKLNASGAMVWSTYYGGNSWDRGYGGCATDSDGNVFFHGTTLSANFPVSADAFQASNGGHDDVYVVKFNPSGERLWATYFGGSWHDTSNGGCSTDNEGSVFIHGSTGSTSFPTSPGAFQSVHGGGALDAFVLKLSSTGLGLGATYYGGSQNDRGEGGCATDNEGNVFIYGSTESSNFPVSPGAFQTSYSGNSDAFIVKFNSLSVPPCPITPSCQSFELMLDESGEGNLSPQDIDNGSTVTCGEPILTLNRTEFDCTDVGIQEVELTVTDGEGNSESCVAQVTVIASDFCYDCNGVLNGEDQIGTPCLLDDQLGIYNELCECEILPAASINGQVDWSSSCGSRTIIIEFQNHMYPELDEGFTETLLPDGSFTTPNISPGMYDVLVTVEGYLSKLYSDVLIESGSNDMFISEIVSGDINGTNGVNINDVSFLSSAFGSSAGDVNYNEIADLNCDASVNIIDFSILNVTFGMVGDNLPESGE